MFVKMYNFSKRENSTKQPTDADVTISGEVCFKHTTSLLTPTIIWAVGHEDNVEGDDTRTDDEKAMVTNYCYMNGKYYYVTDVRRVNRNHIEFDCRIDVLASYKDNIFNSKCYVLYSQSHGRIDIPDNRVPTLYGEKITSQVIEIADFFSVTGTYLMAYVGGVVRTDGLVTVVKLSAGEIDAIAPIFNNEGFFEDLKQKFTNPFSAIAKFYWLPLVSGAIPQQGDTPLVLGGYNTNVPVSPVSGYYIDTEETVELNWDEIYPNLKISTAELSLPYVGNVPLNLEELREFDSFILRITIDIFSGDIKYSIMTPHRVIIQSFTSSCICELPISSDTYNPQRVAGGIITGLSGAVTGALGAVGNVLEGGNPAASALGGVSTAVSHGSFALNQMLEGFVSQTQILGSMGSRIGIVAQTPKLIIRTKTLADNIQPLLGLPLNKVVSLSELSGYVETATASVSINGTLSETQLINNYLNGGIYIE